MKTHHEENPDAYFWYDVFINNQHVLGQTDLGAAFSNAIEEIGTVLCVMSPWNNPTPLRRAWCLWEIFARRRWIFVRVYPGHRTGILEGGHCERILIAFSKR